MSPFVTACVEVVQGATKGDEAVECFSWSLSLVLKMLVRTITEGSSIVMKAVNGNDIKNPDDISALGLRHVGCDIPTEYMLPFETVCVEVV